MFRLAITPASLWWVAGIRQSGKWCSVRTWQSPFLVRCSSVRGAQIALRAIMLSQIIRHGKQAGLVIKLDPVCGVRREFDLSGLCAQAGDHVPNRIPLMKVRKQFHPVSRACPDSQLVNSMAD